ncbi:DALR anticodon-binding domain-containing protein [Suttonella ornithocola]|uniref:DALR anticodon-binding domain-containing protein n=1 Tax=Suttonella ornithocola TaxID=279832 RepID=UPI003D160237
MQALNRRVLALRDFLTQENAASFLDSAKRIRNILKKNGSLKDDPQENRLQEVAEKTLYQQWTSIQPELHNHLENGDYPQALAVLGTLSKPLADFFDNVMVMCDEPKLRMNRLALLSALQRDFDELGDLSLIGVAS